MGQVLFDAVLFDLDGTLVATDAFWAVAAERGARRAFSELGLERELPTPREWLSMVGLPLAQGFAAVFPDLAPELRARVMERCVEESHVALRTGGAVEMTGARELLAELAARGVALGIASNCAQAYLDVMLRELRLGEFVREARCLQSPGIGTKADMIADLLATFGTRAAVMVGDRATDALAAHANGLPHIHLACGLAPANEHVDAEARIGALSELVACLERRERWIARSLAPWLGREGATLGISGRSGTGKSLFARDAARVWAARGQSAAVLALDGFLRTEAERDATPHARADHLAHAFDLGRLESAVLGPRRRGEPTRAGPWGPSVPAGATLFLEGLFLADPRLRDALGALVVLEAPEPLLRARLSAREPVLALRERFLERYLPAQMAFDERHPARPEDLRLDASNPLGPAA